MKRNIVLSVIITVIAFMSCSKDGETAKLDDRLVNTKWQTVAYAHNIIYGGTAYDVYEFISTSEVEKYTLKNGNIIDSDGIFSYVLNYPKLSITNADNKTAIFIFKDTRTFLRYGVEETLPYAKYIRQ